MKITVYRKLSARCGPGSSAAPRVIGLSAIMATMLLRIHTAVGSSVGVISDSPGRMSRVILIPKDPDWARYLLLAVIWTLVIAAVVGPLYRFIQDRRLPPEMIKFRGW